jgi:hypothetical protein
MELYPDARMKKVRKALDECLNFRQSALDSVLQLTLTVTGDSNKKDSDGPNDSSKKPS